MFGAKLQTTKATQVGYVDGNTAVVSQVTMHLDATGAPIAVELESKDGSVWFVPWHRIDFIQR